MCKGNEGGRGREVWALNEPQKTFLLKENRIREKPNTLRYPFAEYYKLSKPV